MQLTPRTNGDRLPVEPRTRGFQSRPCPLHYPASSCWPTAQSPRAWNPESTDFILERNVRFDPETVHPSAPSLSAPYPLGFQQGVSGGGRERPFPQRPTRPSPGAARSRSPLQRVGGDPAGGGADPQAKGDADAVAGEAAVQVAPVPQRWRGIGVGRLPHGRFGFAGRCRSHRSGRGPARSLPGRRSRGRYLPAPPSLGSVLPRRPGGASRPPAGNGRAQLGGPGRWRRRRRRPRLEVKVSGTARPSSPRAIVGGRRAGGAPQRREPGAASTQRLPPPLRGQLRRRCAH